MNQWYATFGGGHTHPLTDEPLKNCYTVILAPTYREAHDLMIRSVFGRQWAFLYEFADHVPLELEGRAKAAGVREYGLREIPFIPPSPVAESLWEAYEGVNQMATISAPLWIDLVLRPAEIAHWRSMAEVGHVAQLTPEAASTLSDPSFWLHAGGSYVAQHPATVDECDGISRSDEVEPAKDVHPSMPLAAVEKLADERAEAVAHKGGRARQAARAHVWQRHAQHLDRELQTLRAAVAEAVPVLQAVDAYAAQCILGTDPDATGLIRAWKTRHTQKAGA